MISSNGSGHSNSLIIFSCQSLNECTKGPTKSMIVLLLGIVVSLQIKMHKMYLQRMVIIKLSFLGFRFKSYWKHVTPQRATNAQQYIVRRYPRTKTYIHTPRHMHEYIHTYRIYAYKYIKDIFILFFIHVLDKDNQSLILSIYLLMYSCHIISYIVSLLNSISYLHVHILGIYNGPIFSAI